MYILIIKWTQELLCFITNKKDYPWGGSQTQKDVSNFYL